jgi:hypothetical protein
MSKKKKKQKDVQISVPKDWEPLFEWIPWHHDKQQECKAALRAYWEVIFCGGNGSGKTHILYWLTSAFSLGVAPYQNKLGMQPPLSIKVLVTDFEHGMDTIAKKTLFNATHMPNGKTVGPMMPESMIDKYWCKEDKTLYLKNGSTIEFMTSEQKRRLHSGTSFDILVCDEEPAKPQYDESVRGLRNAKGGGKIIWGFTPPFEEGRGPSWSKYDKFDKVEEGIVRDTYIVKAAMRDNPAITEDFIRRFSYGKTDEQLRVQLYGEFPNWGQLCFTEYQEQKWDVETKTGNVLPYDWPVPWKDPEATFEFAIDWHPSKPAAAIWTVTTKDGDVVVYDELMPEMAQDKTPGELVSIIKEMEGHRFGPRKIPIRRLGDPKMKDKSNVMIRGQNAWDMFRKEGLYLSEGYNRQPEVGIAIINEYIRGDQEDHPRLFIRENCKNTRTAFRNHYWERNADGTGKPDRKWSDYPICLRYIMQQKRKHSKGHKRRKWGITSYDHMPRFYNPYRGRSRALR